MPHAGHGSCSVGPINCLSDGIKGDFNQALVLLGLVLRMFLVFINSCLGLFCVVTWL